MDTDLRSLLDRAVISEIRANYAHALDMKEWDAALHLFTEDVQFDFSDFGVPPQTVSKQAFIDSFRTNLNRSGLATQHLFTNLRINVQGEAATCVSHFVGHHFLAGAEGGEEFTIRAEYKDTLTKSQNQWLISGTACKLFSMSGNSKLLGW